MREVIGMKGKFTQFALGVLTGAFLFGGATAVAAGITAEPSWSPIYVDGQQVQMTAYNIAGNNFVKLRDIGQAVGFNVYYQDGVQVDSGAPYTGTAPASATAQASVQTVSTEAVRVSCYKDGPLTVGDGSGLMIYPSGVEYTVTSSNPAVVTVEKVMGTSWKVNAMAPGTATITATATDGRIGSVQVTVSGQANAQANEETSVDLSANMDIRLEMVRHINEVRRQNGKPELPIEESLMNAAQDVSAQCATEHRPYDHKALIRYGWPHGGLYNLVRIYVDYYPNLAQTAIDEWVDSPGHFRTMLLDEASCVGTGVTVKDGIAYCYMVVGDPTAHNPYE